MSLREGGRGGYADHGQADRFHAVFGQVWEIPVELFSTPFETADVVNMTAAFAAACRRLFGRTIDGLASAGFR